ncbi:ABC transporter permease [Vineibacter terrae]|uniref:ABC transporter permease n=1 Tax=Vineibacter terrae TaxID=2586908 RepID=UPI002E32303B|nr:ABC transporter permease [Vineibacter terrae]HEX2887417.1 ABC transporter permease [Vineibacter terrae]
MTTLTTDSPAPARRLPRLRIARGQLLAWLGFAILAAIVLTAVLAPVVAPYDPLDIDPAVRMADPGAEHLFGTDALGRDVLSRVLWGGRVSLLVGLGVALLATSIGLLIGLVAGYFTIAGAVIMRVMDGLMAIPGILLAVAMMTLAQASLTSVIIAITVPEIPRIVRLVRATVLTVGHQTFVEAAIASGTPTWRILLRHILPNIAAPLSVLATFVMASAVLAEAYLGFLGVGVPPDIPSWGNMMAEGRSVIQLGLWVMVFPGLFLGLTVFSINLLGDRLRDSLDPRLARRL